MIKGLAAISLSAPLLLAGCDSPEKRKLVEAVEKDVPAPALWQIESAEGETEGWLFGTIHALPDGVTWRTAKFNAALSQAELLVVEVDDLDDESGLSAIFTDLARTDGLPPLNQRVGTEYQGRLQELLRKAGRKPGDFTATETWAAALTLAQVDPVGDSANGVDRALTAGHCCVVALEGARKQLGIFDALPEADQRDLLEALIAESGTQRDDSAALMKAWRGGDMDTLVRETTTGMLADPELRLALLTGRNRNWAMQIDDLVRAKGPLMVAVGTAHLVGDEGLPALLQQRGYTIRRIQ